MHRKIILSRRLKYLSMRVDIVHLMLVLIVGGFAVTAITAYFSPIYPDEIAARIWLSRLVYDFPERINLYPTCVSAFSQPLPVTWVVPSFIEWAIHGNIENYRTLRLIGVLFALFGMAMLAAVLPISAFEIFTDKSNGEKTRFTWKRLLYSFGFVTLLFSTGVLPIFLFSNRQEQLILPAIILGVYLFIVSKRENDAVWKTAVIISSYFLALSLILYAHPKGIFLTPFILLVGYKLIQNIKNCGLQLLFAVISIAHIIVAYVMWKNSFLCPETPQLEILLRSFSIDPATLLYNPHAFIQQLQQSLMNFERYLHQLGFQAATDANYLPAFPLGPYAKLANVFIHLNFVIAFFTILVLLPLRYYWIDVRSRSFVTINATLFVLLVCLIISALFNIPKNWYDAGYLYVGLMIIWIFFIGENFRGIFQRPIGRIIFIYLACVALLSQAVFIHRYLPAFWDGYAGPSISVVNYDHSKMLEELTAASRACDIDPARSKKVIVDDYTYLYFHKSRQPMAISYIFYGNNAASSQKFISEAGSDGLIARCSSIATYMPFAKRAGDVCCVSKNDLNKLPPPY
jgi:hypothetical protein